MRIDAHLLCHQEAPLVPYVMRHYKDWVDNIYLYAGYSTDGTEEMAEKLGAKIIFLETHNELNDAIFREMKNNCWKGSSADWVIVGDFDELVYHPNIKDSLAKKNATIIKTQFYNMYSDSFPTEDMPIIELVKDGTKAGTKMNLFRPSALAEINYGAGCHEAHPVGDVIIEENDNTDIWTLHYRNFGIDYVFKRNDHLAKRMSKVNLDNHWGFGVLSPKEETEAWLMNQKKHAFRVL